MVSIQKTKKKQKNKKNGLNYAYKKHKSKFQTICHLKPRTPTSSLLEPQILGNSKVKAKVSNVIIETIMAVYFLARKIKGRGCFY